MKQDWTRELSARLAPLRLRPERELEIIDELAQHLDERVRELVAAGDAPETAIRRALDDLDAPGVLAKRLGAIEAPSPYTLPPPGTPSRGRWLRAWAVDLTHSVRALRRTPAFTAAVIVTMALTIGPTTAMLSIGNWLLWEPIAAVEDGSRLGVIYFGRWQDGGSVRPNRISPHNLSDLMAASRTMQSLAGTQESVASVAIEGQMAQNIGTAHADANLFETLGVRPSAGRFFNAEEDVLPHGALVAVVSDGLARRAFGTPEGALGKTVLVNGRRLSVVGVAPAGFRGIEPVSLVDVWYPGAAYRYLHHFSSIPPATRGEGTFYTFVFRLKAGATFESAQAELDVLTPALVERFPQDNSGLKDVRARVYAGMGPTPLTRDRLRTMVNGLLTIGAVLVVLGCANVANLLMFRSVRRGREPAIRAALGAARTRLLQLQLMETCLLMVAGAALGVGLASAIARLILTLLLPSLYVSGVELEVPIDARVLLATLVLSIVCGLAAGFIPSWLSVNRSVSTELSHGGGRATPRGHRLRTGFAVVQLALSLALLVGALLMVTTLRGLNRVDLGFDMDHVTAHSFDLSSQGYTEVRGLQYLRELETGLSSMSAFESVSLSSSYPLGSGMRFRVRGPGGGNDNLLDINMNLVSRDYFTVLGIPILKGRAFTTEEANAPAKDGGNAVVISQSVASRLFGDSDPIGRNVGRPGGRNAPDQLQVVVGVVGDVHDLMTGQAELSLYEPLARVWPFAARPTLLVNTNLPPQAVTEAVRAVASRIDSTVPINPRGPLRTQTIDRRLASQRVFAWVLSLLGSLGFVLAAVGLYGLLAQGVAERAREFGIRMAIGATSRQIFSLVLRQAARIAMIGGVAGLTLAAFGSRLIEAQLWGVTTREPSIYVIATLALVTIVFVAATWPARAATRIEPVEILKSD